MTNTSVFEGDNGIPISVITDLTGFESSHLHAHGVEVRDGHVTDTWHAYQLYGRNTGPPSNEHLRAVLDAGRFWAEMEALTTRRAAIDAELVAAIVLSSLGQKADWAPPPTSARGRIAWCETWFPQASVLGDQNLNRLLAERSTVLAEVETRLLPVAVLYVEAAWFRQRAVGQRKGDVWPLGDHPKEPPAWLELLAVQAADYAARTGRPGSLAMVFFGWADARLSAFTQRGEAPPTYPKRRHPEFMNQRWTAWGDDGLTWTERHAQASNGP